MNSDIATRPLSDSAVQPGLAGRSAALQCSTVSQALVELVADRVYAMLALELRIEQERERFTRSAFKTEQGGWS